MHNENYIIENKETLNLTPIVQSQKLSLNTLYQIYDCVDLTTILMNQDVDIDFIKNVILNVSNWQSSKEKEISLDDIFLFQKLTNEEKQELTAYVEELYKQNKFY